MSQIPSSSIAGCMAPSPSCPRPQVQVVNGTDGSDVVHISRAQGLAGCLGLYEVNVNGQSQLMTRQQLEHTQFNLGAGNDLLVVDPNVKASVHADGGKGHDLMTGGGGNDVLTGGKGRDLILGGGGHDTISGGKGRDLLIGGHGHDLIGGGRGRDLLIGGEGHDRLHGGRGDDIKRPDWQDLLPPPPHRLLAALLA